MEPFLFEEEKQKLRKLLKRRLKASKKYIIKCQTLLEKALTWQKELHLAELMSAHLYLIKRGMREIQIPDWESDGNLITLLLDPSLKPSDEVAKRFKLSKKLKVSQDPLQRQLRLALRENTNLIAQLQELESIEEESLRQFKEKYDLALQKPVSKYETHAPPLPYHEFFSENNIPIWVGKNARGNDAMTFKHANGNDYWLHIADYPGSHIIIHASGREIDEGTLQDALQLAIFYSKGKEGGKADVTITQKKYVSKLGKQAGKVQVSNQKNILATIDPDRIKKIRSRIKE